MRDRDMRVAPLLTRRPVAGSSSDPNLPGVPIADLLEFEGPRTVGFAGDFRVVGEEYLRARDGSLCVLIEDSAGSWIEPN